MRRISDAFKVNKQNRISEVSLWLGVIIFPWDCRSCLVNLMCFHVIGSIEKLRNAKLERGWCSWHNKRYNSKAKPSLASKPAHGITESLSVGLGGSCSGVLQVSPSAVFCCGASYLHESTNASPLPVQEFLEPNYRFKSFFQMYTLATVTVLSTSMSYFQVLTVSEEVRCLKYRRMGTK